MNSARGATLAALLLLAAALPGLLGVTALAAPRHPWQATPPPTTQLTLPYNDYVCLVNKAVREVRLLIEELASAPPRGASDLEWVNALHLASLAYGRLERGASLLGVQGSSAWEAAMLNLRQGAALLYLASIYGYLEAPEARIGCGGIALTGNLASIVAALSSAVLDDDRVAVPLPPSVSLEEAQAPGAAGGGAAGNPRAEELFRQEKLPDAGAGAGEAARGGFGAQEEEPPGLAPGYSPGETGDLAEVNIEDYLRSILSAVGASGGGAGGGAPGDGGGVAAAPARFVDAVGRVTLSVDTLLRLAEALSSLRGGGEPLVSGVEAEPASPPEGLLGLWAALGFAAVGGLSAVAIARAPELRMIARRLIRRPRPAGEVEQCYKLVLSDLASAGLERMPWEAPREYAERVSEKLPGAAATALLEATRLYERVAYGGYEPGEDEAARCWSLRDEVGRGLGG